MPDFLSIGRTGFDLVLVILGFGFIIFIHELGHFLAAKWAGIRVLAFAVGFGPAAVSYRKGIGFRRGSTEQEYLALVKNETAGINRISPNGVSPTEYRLNWLPLGGYVKMLGQDDLDPTAVSPERDSYQNTPVWKRMVVISAGVVMNIVLAAFLFIAVFMHGLDTEPPFIGAVDPSSPAGQAVAVNAAVAGVREVGLRPGDEVKEVNGRLPREFNELVMASAMSSRDELVSLIVQRPGVTTPLRFEIRPQTSRASRLLEIGVSPAMSSTLMTVRGKQEAQEFEETMARIGLPGVKPGMVLERAGGKPVNDAADLEEAVHNSGGAPVRLEFAGAGERVSVSLRPRAVLQRGWVRASAAEGPAEAQHLLGLIPVMRVAPQARPGDRQKLENDDIFRRIGTVEYPSMPQGLAEVHRYKGSQIDVTVLRTSDGKLDEVTLDPRPKVQNIGLGQIGFVATNTSDISTLVSLPLPMASRPDSEPAPTPAAQLITRPGTRIISIAAKPVSDFGDIRAALLAAAAGSDPAATTVTIPVELEPPLAGASAHPKERVDWRVPRSDLDALRDLSWDSPLDSSIFEPRMTTLKAKNPGEAITMGLGKTQRVMMMTYLTFARLFEGTVKVEHLKGPVGIAHMGTRIAERGFTWLLFFMALISVNLAVINFLPLPIVDGGQFIFLILEQVRGKPVSVEVQNVATVLGLVLIGAVFVIVTFQDISGLFS